MSPAKALFAAAVLALSGCNGSSGTFSACSATSSFDDLVISIDGAGLFTLADEGELVYTILGDFCANSDSLVVTAAGYALQIFPAANGLINTGTLVSLAIPVQNESASAFAGFVVDSDGFITTLFADSSQEMVGRLALATFPVPSALAVDGVYCRETLASEPARRGLPGEAGFGTIKDGPPDVVSCNP